MPEGPSDGQPAPGPGGARRPDPLVAILLAAGLLAVRVPFALTGDFQEDAYITWRTARNLADHGEYSFNLSQPECPVTSHAYALLCAGVRALSGEAFIPVVTGVNCVLVVAACYLLAGALVEAPRRRLWLWVLLGLTPVAVEISICGMETALLAAAVAVGADGVRRGRFGPGHLAAITLLPWIRPDAVAVGLILLAAAWWRGRRLPWRGGAALLVGAAALAAFNWAQAGTVLQRTIVAKDVAYQPVRSAAAWAQRMWRLFGARSFLLPLSSKYLFPLSWATSLAMLALGVLAVVRARRRGVRSARAAALAVVLVLPAAYAYGGIIFPWYLWPSRLAAYALALVVVAGWLDAPRWRLRAALVVAAAGVLLVGQYALSFSRGTLEQEHRAAVGRWLRRSADSTDTLLLEPAGYIPYYAGLFTWDEIGLVTEDVTDAMRRHGGRWWIEFVKARRPVWLVERDPMLAGRAPGGYDLTAEEAEWFRSHYRLVRSFVYRPDEHADGALARYILRLGTAHSFHVYRLAPERPTTRRGRADTLPAEGPGTR